MWFNCKRPVRVRAPSSWSHRENCDPVVNAETLIESFKVPLKLGVLEYHLCSSGLYP